MCGDTQHLGNDGLRSKQSSDPPGGVADKVSTWENEISAIPLTPATPPLPARFDPGHVRFFGLADVGLAGEALRLHVVGKGHSCHLVRADWEVRGPGAGSSISLKSPCARSAAPPESRIARAREAERAERDARRRRPSSATLGPFRMHFTTAPRFARDAGASQSPAMATLASPASTTELLSR